MYRNRILFTSPPNFAIRLSSFGLGKGITNKANKHMNKTFSKRLVNTGTNIGLNEVQNGTIKFLNKNKNNE